MQKITGILLLVLVSFISRAQVVFKTDIPQHPVVVGEPFRVQYVLEGLAEYDNFLPQFFNDFRRVSGPDTYTGSVYKKGVSKPLVNFVFTLVAQKPGRFIIPGATVRVKEKFIESGDEMLEVITKAEAIQKSGNFDNGSEYFLRPEEDPYEKIRNNLFMKVMVNKHHCFVGEPVVATFKLYSRLQSKSDIVKNPGFYGFSVQDIISLDDHISHIETVNGKAFDVHTVRSVQLYPLQAGILNIDPMEVLNRVEFSKSMVNKKTEQEINEGVFENREKANSNLANTVTYESSISTEKIEIKVKPWPVKNKPDDFTGATGRLQIRAFLQKNDLAKNEEGGLIVTIEGKGNFTQLSAPIIHWPTDIEGFDPAIKDSLDKNSSPLTGTRSFHFPFVAGKAGTYLIDGIPLSFFDPDSNIYKTVVSKPVEIRISEKEIELPSNAQAIDFKTRKPNTNWWVVGAIALALATLGWMLMKKRRNVAKAAVLKEKKVRTIDEILQPAYIAMEKNDSQFYSVLQKIIWDHLGFTLNLSGSKMNKYDLEKALQKKMISKEHSREILDILQECEAAAFTKAEFIHDKQELLKKTKSTLQQISS